VVSRDAAKAEALANELGGGATAPPRGALQTWANVTSLADRPDLRVATQSSIVRSVEIVKALLAARPKFAEPWAQHDVLGFHGLRKRFDHPEVGRAEYR
jgi:hypothetical protein